jgi:hypothetical protein
LASPGRDYERRPVGEQPAGMLGNVLAGQPILSENAEVRRPDRWKLAADSDILVSGRLRAMVGEQNDQLKQKYTDKYVVVDAQRPELARFRDVVGQVKTVNMSGRALVEFLDYHINIGWYDIDPSFLKLVDKPAPKPKEAPAKKAAAPAAKKDGEPAAAGGAAAKKLSPLEMARAQGAAGKGGAAAPAKPTGGKASTADILGAARGGIAPAAKAEAKPAPAASTSAPAKVDRSKMTVADMLAAARAGAVTGAAPAAAPPAVQEAAKSAPAVEKAPAAAASAAKAPSGETVDKSKMTIDEMIAWCRQHDTK